MKEALILLAAYLEKSLKDELLRQNHVASKKLLDSIEVVCNNIANGYTIEGSFLSYGSAVDTGTKPGHKIPIKDLIDWMRFKKIQFAGKSELQTAFLIRNSIFKRGTPTDGDPNKKRWLSLTLEKNEQKIIDDIEALAFGSIEIEFNNLIERTQRVFDNEVSVAA